MANSTRHREVYGNSLMRDASRCNALLGRKLHVHSSYARRVLRGLIGAVFTLALLANLSGNSEATSRIGIRGNPAEFYDTASGLSFTPRGNNYVRLALAPDEHSTFTPGRYDATAVEAALNRMQLDGYNVVRVFFSNGIAAGVSGPGLDPAYMANVADFLRRALNRTRSVWTPSRLR
jgi:hypothetical protein